MFTIRYMVPTTSVQYGCRISRAYTNIHPSNEFSYLQVFSEMCAVLAYCCTGANSKGDGTRVVSKGRPGPALILKGSEIANVSLFDLTSGVI